MSDTLIINGRYATELNRASLLGQGSMGDVYLGVDIQTEKPVAIKVLKPDVVSRNPQVVERFLREGEVLAQLNHPNIVQLIDSQETEGQYYLVMGYAAGGSLQDMINRTPQLPLDQTLRIGLELADALARAHHLGIIHRDLKPANILLDEDGTVRLTDFGMARMLDRSRLTQSDVVVGTVKYLSPEACNGEALDHRADIWALGVVLFEMLVGRPPFLGDNMGATINAILSQEPPDLEWLRADAPRELATLIYQMLAKERDQRLSSARQAGATLEQIAAEEKQPHSKSIWPQATVMERKRAKSGPTTRDPTKDSQAKTARANRSSDQLILLEKVGRFWVQGVLAKAADQAGLITLSRQPYDQAVDNPWQDAVGQDMYRNKAGELDGTIEGVFKSADRALLILGDAGAGKTTTLIALAEQLMSAAERDATQPLPVILSLASWAEKQPPISEWVVSELQAKYQIPRSLGQKWLDGNELALLLDGLDEMPGDAQTACIQAINQFRKTHGLTGIVVCGRTEDYEASDARLKFGGAVRIRSLTAEQVESYLAQAGEKLAGLRKAINHDEVLAEMAQTPLMLSVMSLAYQQSETGSDMAITIPDPNQPEDVSIETHRRHLFGAYLSRMYQRRVANTRFTAEQTTRWLSWLARQMTANHQTVFLIEQLQPGWLPAGPWRWIYLILTRILAGIGVGLFVSLYRFDYRFVPLDAAFGLGQALIHGFLFERQTKLPPAARNITVGLLAMGLTTVVFQLLNPDESIATSLYWGLLNGIGLGLANGLVFGRSYNDDIRTTERLQWDWRQAFRAAVPALALALPLGFLGERAFGFTGGQQWSLASEVGMAFALFGGLRGSRLERTSRPNEGIWLSLRNAGGAAILFGFVMGLLLTLVSGPEFGVRRLVQFTLGASMAYGALNAVNHLILRLLLERRGDISGPLAHFLDHAVGLVFLHKVGGGYIFIHRLLQEYFAEENF